MPLSPEEIEAAKTIYRNARLIQRQRESAPFTFWGVFLFSLAASLHAISNGEFVGWFYLCLSLLLLVLGIILRKQHKRTARRAAIISRVLEREHLHELNALKKEDAELDREFLVFGQRM